MILNLLAFWVASAGFAIANPVEGPFNGKSVIEFVGDFDPGRNLVAGAWAQSDSGEIDSLRCTMAVSVDSGSTWTPNFSYVASDFVSAANPTVQIHPDGRVFAVCMSINSGPIGGALDLLVSEDQGQTWNWVSRIAENKVDGFPDKPVVAIDDSGDIWVAYADVFFTQDGDRLTGIITKGNITRSQDGGKSFQALHFPSRNPKKCPRHNIIGDATLTIHSVPGVGTFASWVEYCGGVLVSKFNGTEFEPPLEVASPQIAGPVISNFYSSADGSVIGLTYFRAHRFETLAFSYSTDGGQTWTDALEICDNCVMSSGFFKDGQFFVATQRFDEATKEHRNEVFIVDLADNSVRSRVISKETLSQTPGRGTLWIGNDHYYFRNGGAQHLFGFQWNSGEPVMMRESEKACSDVLQ